MLIDGISLVDNSVISNSHVETGSTFPNGPTAGRMFYLDTTNTTNTKGLYVYNGSAWVTGDITKVTVGTGLLGGGVEGDVSVSVDTSVIATKAYADQVVAAATLPDQVAAGTYTKVTTNAKGLITAGALLSATDVDTALGFVPYNSTNPSSFVNAAQASAAAPVQTVAGRTGAVVVSQADVGLALVENKTSATIRSEITSGNVVAGLGFTPYNNTNPAAFVNAAQASAAAPVQTVAGRSGAVVLSSTDVAEGTNKYYTDSRASAAAPVQTVAGRSGAVVLTNADVGLSLVENKSSTTIRSELSSTNVTSALGFTPVNAAVVGAASGIAQLDATGKIVSTQLPAIAITDTFVVSSETAMLALSQAHIGDIAVRTDISKTFVLATAGASTLANWQELLTPPNAVQSVNGQVGAIVLTSTNVAEGTNQYFTNARASAAAPVQTVAGRSGTVVLATSDVAESTNLYFTAARASAAAPVQSVAGRTGAVVLAVGDVSGAAPLASPALTGTPTAPTAATADNSVAIATTAFVKAQNYVTYATAGGQAPVQSVAGRTGAVVLAVADVSGAAPLASPALTGTPTAPTAATADSSTVLATTAFVKAQNYITSAGAPVQSVFGRTGAVVLASGDVTGALGFTPVNAAIVAQPNGLATLDATGKLPASQLTSAVVGAVVYQGTWNASTNTPALTSGTGTKGQYYKVAVAGSTSVDGLSQWNIGDTIIFNGTTWDKLDGVASEVTSVAGRTGTVVLATADVAESTNLYFTNARASAAAPVQTVAGRSGAVVLTTADVTGTIDGGSY
jgi:hypothetical protein